MSKKPSFKTTKEQRLLEAKQELREEAKLFSDEKTVQTTLIIEASLLYAVKEIALNRKRTGTKPDTVTGIIREALKELVEKEKFNK